MLVKGVDYTLRMKFGDLEAAIDPHATSEFTITQDIHSFLPHFKIKTVDRQRLFTHVIPFDRRVNRLFIQFAGHEDVMKGENHNYFDFVVWRKYPDSDGVFHVEGSLDIDGLFYPKRRRGFKGSIKDNLIDIAKDDLNLTDTDISPSLDKTHTFTQTNQTDADLLTDLRNRSTGAGNEACYFCFIRIRRGKREFVFRSLNDFITAEPTNNFAFFREKVEDYYPIYQYQIIDTHTSCLMKGYKTQLYSYFDYENGKYVENSFGIQDYLSLSEKFLIDENNLDDVSVIDNLGRSGVVSDNFVGEVKGAFYRALTSLSKMWITTQGLQNVCPGDIVLLAYPGAMISGKILDYQYSGYWLVERIVHSFGTSYTSKILLTRNGVDSTVSTTLISATKKKSRARDYAASSAFPSPTPLKTISKKHKKTGFEVV